MQRNQCGRDFGGPEHRASKRSGPNLYSSATVGNARHDDAKHDDAKHEDN